VVSEAILRARWIETVTIHLKKMGLSFDAISEQITRFGRGQAQSIVAIPEGIRFVPDYTISRQACHKAFKKDAVREQTQPGGKRPGPALREPQGVVLSSSGRCL
jgi:hypothetical protein